MVNKDSKGIKWVLVYVAGAPYVAEDDKASGEVEFGQGWNH